MKVVFAGPSIYGATIDRQGIDVRPPAAHGDLLRAVLEGASVIGLIDGVFEAVASVWHKEILYALSVGVSVLGGGSMGALRAAECAPFGMEPVGVVAKRYIDGLSDDDADVAIIHGPLELGCPPLSEALVDCEATFCRMAEAGLISEAEAVHIGAVARSIHYKDRTPELLARAAFPHQAREFAIAYARLRTSVKTLDAIELFARVHALPASRTSLHHNWELSWPPMWKDAYRRIQSEILGEVLLADASN